MAKDLELALKITAKDNTGNALSKTRAGLESISSQLAVAKAQFIAFQASMLSLGRVQALVELADKIQLTNARLKQATGSLQEFAAAQALAYRIAAQTGAGYEAIATLYSRLSLTAKDYGLSQKQIGDVTIVTAKALQISGASASEAASTVRQLSQALSSGVLRGDEFNSMMENAPRLARALADGLGLPIGKLRALSEAGILSTELVAKALESQRTVLEREAATMPRTVGVALSAVSDQFGKAVNELNQSSGATKAIAAAFATLADHMREVLGGVAVVAVGALTAASVRGGIALQAYIAAVIAKMAAERQAAISSQVLLGWEVRKAGALLASAQAAVAASTGMARLAIVENALVPAQQRLAATQAALASGMVASGTAVRGLSAVMGLLGGPIGLITTLLTVGATAWAIWGNNAKSAGDKAKEAIDRARDASERLRREQKFGTGDAADLREGIAALEARQSVLQESVATAGSKGAAEALKNTNAELGQRRKDLADLEAKDPTVATGGPTALGREVLHKQFLAYIKQYRDDTGKFSDAIGELKQKAKEAGIAETSPEFLKAAAAIRAKFSNQALPDLTKPFEADLKALQEALKTQSDIIETALAGQLITAASYYQAKAAIQQRELSTEREILTRELAAQTDLVARLDAAKPKDASQKAKLATNLGEARNRAAELKAQLDALDGREIAAKFKLDVDAKKARQDIADAIAGAQEELARLTGTETPEMRRAAIERGMRELIARVAGDAEAAALVNKLIDVRAADANLAALEARWKLATETMRNAEASVNIQQSQGLITTTAAQAQIAAAHRQAATELEALLPLMESAANAIGPEAVAKVAAWKNELATVKDVVNPMAASLKASFSGSISTFFTDLTRGAKTFGDALRDLVRSFAQAVAKMAADALAADLMNKLFKGGSSGGSSAGGWIDKATKFIVGLFHEGGVVGSAGGLRRSVNPLVFAGAPRFHAGGLAGLKPGEVPAILQKGEEVLTRNDPRHAANGGGAGAGGNMSLRMVLVDDQRKVGDYLQSAEGERVLVQALRRNSMSLKQFA